MIYNFLYFFWEGSTLYVPITSTITDVTDQSRLPIVSLVPHGILKYSPGFVIAGRSMVTGQINTVEGLYDPLYSLALG